MEQVGAASAAAELLGDDVIVVCRVRAARGAAVHSAVEGGNGRVSRGGSLSMLFVRLPENNKGKTETMWGVVASDVVTLRTYLAPRSFLDSGELMVAWWRGRLESRLTSALAAVIRVSKAFAFWFLRFFTSKLIGDFNES